MVKRVLHKLSQVPPMPDEVMFMLVGFSMGMMVAAIVSQF